MLAIFEAMFPAGFAGGNTGAGRTPYGGGPL